MTVISIQSVMVHGRVGNSAAVPVLEAHGLPVAAVPTALLSNHPHYPTMRGSVLDPTLLGDLLLGVEERGLISGSTIILTGYLGSADNGEVVARFVDNAKRRQPSLLYVCDPVCGDEDIGAFADPALRRMFAERLLPLADVATPNGWELRSLTGIGDVTGAVRALQALGPARVVVTGGDTVAAELETLAFEEHHAARIRCPRLPPRPAGTGDLFTASLTARLMRSDPLSAAAAHAVAACFAVIEQTASEPWSEMPIGACLADIVSPRRRFPVEPWA